MEGHWLLVLLVVHGVSCAFFDLTDVDDPLALLWHTKDTITPNFTECSVFYDDGSSAIGQCKHKTLCLLSGGQINRHGSCGFLSTCCTQRTNCYKKTKSKVSYFISDSNSLSDCQFVVEAQNNNVCQVRIDFELFRIAPTEEITNEDTQTSRTVCRNDYMTITPTTYNIPRQFCGNNSGQHVYVHLYSQRDVTLHVHLANRTFHPALLPNPHWKIKITQLECPGPKNFFTHGLESDYMLLAPEGAIQYFTAPSGTVKSFGFDSGQTNYLSGLHYAIAFKRTPYVNCLRFLGRYISLRQTTGSGAVQCLDYIAVPELRPKLTPETWKICPTGSISPVQNFFFSAAPGSFYLDFFSQSIHPTPDSPAAYGGFDLHYDSTSCNADF